MIVVAEDPDTIQQFPSPDSVPRDCVERALAFEPGSDPARFAAFFRRLRRVYPEETILAILRKLASCSLDPFTTEALEWLAGTGRYLPYLLDSKILAREGALSVAKQMRETDPKFLLNFTTLLECQEHSSDPALLASALTLLAELQAYDPLFWWLYNLTRHPDQRIRSKAAKAVCEVRPKAELIKRQLQSQDARVRANAIEALWGTQDVNATRVFRQALSDTSHRVVMNGLVGLYIHGDDKAFDQILEYAQHASPLFQSAAAWALGCIRDERGAPALEKLKSDRCAMVRKRAQSSLERLAEKQLEKSISTEA